MSAAARAASVLRQCLVLLVLLMLLPLVLGAAPPQDPLVSQQPHLPTVRTFEAWDVRRGEDAVVAVLDTGVDLDHPDLAGRLVEGVDLIDPGTPPDDPQGHGTIVAGIIAAVANNSRGVAGVAPQAKILPIRVLDAQGRGTADVVADGIRHAIEQEVDVINLSLAEVQREEDDGQDGQVGPPVLSDVSLVQSEGVVAAIEEAHEAGILVVAAAGNDGDDATPYDRDTPVLVVGATDEDGYVWEDSNHDDRTIFAPGVRILSTWSEGRYARSNGTSFATPIVSAGAAMLLGSGMSLDEAVERLTTTTVPVGLRPAAQSGQTTAPSDAQPTPTGPHTPPPVAPGQEVGLGRVDLAAAVQGVTPAPTPTSTPPPPPPSQEPIAETGPPPSPAAGDGSLGEVEVVEEVPVGPATPAPATVTAAPPDIEAGPGVTTIPPSAGASDGAVFDPVEVVPEPSDPTANGLSVASGAQAGEEDRGGPILVASMLMGANVAFAGVIVRGRTRPM